MQRAARIQALKARVALWDTGAGAAAGQENYKYDGASNIVRMGRDWYVYDQVSRVVEGSVMAAGQKKQYSYDAFGNMLNVKTFNNVSGPLTGQLTEDFSTGANSSNNRLGLNYDAAGNTLGVVGQPYYTYDGVNMIKYAPGFTYLYDADDERVWKVDRRAVAPTPIPPPPAPSVSDTVWVEDNLPAGAVTAVNDDSWNWIASNPSPLSGNQAHQSNIFAGMHQHFFDGATSTLTIGAGESLIAYVFVDSANPPSE